MNEAIKTWAALYHRGELQSPFEHFLCGLALGALGARVSQEDIVKMVADAIKEGAPK